MNHTQIYLIKVMINLQLVSKLKVILLHTLLKIHFFFNLSHVFLNNYKKPIKNEVKTLLQQNPLLNDTDLYEDDDRRIPQQNSH